MKKRFFLLVLGAFLLFPPAAFAIETDIVVRVLAHDGKFIGSGMGGVQAVLKEARTGKILDAGVIEGPTGNTDVLIKTPRSRSTDLSQGGAAKWVGKIDIEAPTRIRLEVTGPLAAGANQQEISKTFWVLPGQDIDGDGLMVELYGFVVQPVSPGVHQKLQLGEKVTVEAHVVMMCGCPVGPEELWDSRNYEIKALIKKGSETVAEFPLEFTGTVSRFAGSFQPKDSGTYQVTMTAADPRHNNFGVGLTTVVIEPE